MKISIKIDAKDTQQVTEAAAQAAAWLSRISLANVLSLLEELASDIVGEAQADAGDESASDGEPGSNQPSDGLDYDSKLKLLDAIRREDMSSMTGGALFSAGINSLDDLADYTAEQLLRIKGIDHIGLAECREVLAQYDMHLRGEEA